MSKKLKDIGVVSLLTVVSRFLGLARDQISAWIFGDSLLNSAFVTAFRLPNLFRRLLGEGSLTAAFLPTLQHELHENGRAGAYTLLNKVASWLALITASLCVAAMLLFTYSGGLIQHFASNDPKWFLVRDLSVLLFPYLAFVCVAASLNAALNVFERFTEPALSPIWLNLCMIVSLGGAGYHLAHSKLGEMHWLCAGVLFGGVLQMIVPAGVLMWQGWKPRFDLALSPRVKEIARLMLPGFLGTAIYQVNLLVSSYLVMTVDDNSATVMFYAGRLMELPIGVFAIAVSTVVYPLIARHAVQKNYTAMADDFRKGIRLILIINVPAAVGLSLLSHPIVRLIYQHGHFDVSATNLMTPLLALYAVGLPFFSVVNLTVRAFYSVRDLSTPVRVAVFDFFVNLILSLALMRHYHALGLVAASTTAIIVQTILLQRALLRKLPQLTLLPLWRSMVKVLIGAAVMGVVVELSWMWLLHRNGPGKLSSPTAATAVFALIPLGVLVYAASLWALRIEGRDELAAVFARFRKR